MGPFPQLEIIINATQALAVGEQWLLCTSPRPWGNPPHCFRCGGLLGPSCAFFCGDHGASGANSGLFLCSSSPQLKGNVVLLGAIVGAWGNPQHCFRCGGLLCMLFCMHLRLIFGLLWGRLRAVISSCYCTEFHVCL